MYLKRTSQCHGFNVKLVYKMGHPGPRYLRKNQMGLQFGFACHVWNYFTNISPHGGVVRFSNWSFHWNRGIETVVLSTIIAKNGVFKYPKFFQRASRIASKTLNCGNTWPDWGKRHLWLLIEWTQVKYSRHLFFSFILFPSVISLYLYLPHNCL